jgi:hypothetical protein
MPEMAWALMLLPMLSPMVRYPLNDHHITISLNLQGENQWKDF